MRGWSSQVMSGDVGLICTQPATMRGLLPLVTLSLVTPAPQFSTLQNRFEGFDFSQLVSDLKDQVKPKVDAVNTIHKKISI